MAKERKERVKSIPGSKVSLEIILKIMITLGFAKNIGLMGTKRLQ